MIIVEFCKAHDVKQATVTNYITRHPEEFEGHTKKRGKAVELDDEAVRLLDIKYPIPKPVTVINGVPEEEHLRIVADKDAKIQELYEIIHRLKDNEIARIEEISELKQQTYLLEDTQQRLTEKEAEIERIKDLPLLDRILKRY